MIKNICNSVIICLFIFGCSSKDVRKSDLTIRVDITKKKGPMTPVWAWFGYDEPNYTYMKDGRKLLSELAALSPEPSKRTATRRAAW